MGYVRSCLFGADRSVIERDGKLVSAPRDGRNGLRAEQLAQRCNLYGDVAFFDNQPRPNRFEQFVLGDHAIGVVDQGKQQIVGSGADRYRFPCDAQAAFGHMHLAAPESMHRCQGKPPCVRVRRTCRTANPPGHQCSRPI